MPYNFCMEKKVIEFTKSQGLNLSCCGVACSGGVDSMSLLWLLWKNKEEFGIKRLVCLNVNHNIRGAESDRDTEFVRTECKKCGIEFFGESVDATNYAKEHKQTLEQGAREVRNQALLKMAKEQNLQAVLLAHHADDQAETVLMHLFRGAGLKGVCGMSVKNGIFVRPLLCVSRDEIEEYASREKIPFVLDSTNLETDYSRNFLRRNIMPLINQKFAGATANVAKFAALAQKDNEFIEQNSQKFVKKIGTKVLVENAAKNECDSLKYRALALGARLAGATKDVETRHLDILSNLFDMSVGKQISLPFGVVATKSYDGIVFGEKEQGQEAPFALGETPFGGKIICASLEPVDLRDKSALWIDLDKVPTACIWRNIKRGDKMLTFGGDKKLVSDFLTDKKIDRTMREQLAVLACESEVFAILGVDISAKLKIDESTKNVVKIWIK